MKNWGVSMKKIGFAALIIVFIAVMVYGKIHYDQKIASTVQPDEEHTEEESSVSGAETTSSNGLPEGTQEEFGQKLQESIDAGEELTIVLSGSGALESAEENVPALLQEKLRSFYETEDITVQASTFGDSTSLEVMAADGDVTAAELEPDVLIFEPFVLNDNGQVSVDDTLFNTNAFVNTVEAANPEAAVFIQPPQPVYEARYYIDQVEALQADAGENNLNYINHWEAWPDTEDAELEEQYLEENGDPSVEGHELWAQALTDYFTGEEAL